MSAKEDFSDQKFRIECSHMALTQLSNNPLVIAGPGEIWQDEEGVLQFKIFINRQACQSLDAYMARPGVVGQLIPDGDYFRLEAQEYSHPIWTASNVLPELRSGPAGGFAYGHLPELVHAETHPPNSEFDFLTIRFRGKLRFPCNQGTETIIRVGGQDRQTSMSLNAAFIDDREFQFEVYHDEEHTVVSLQLPAGQLTAATPDRVREALQFILGQQLARMVVETSVGGQHVTRLLSPSRGNGRISPPLNFHRLDQGGHVWRMFTNYFRHVHSNAETGWHPISRHIGSVIESTAASLEAQVLALAVAVEGLAGHCFSSLAPVSQDFLTELDAVQAALPVVRTANANGETDGLALSDRTLNRVNGSLNSMREPRNSDVLRAFIRNHRLPNGLYNSWSRLRNAAAHGGGGGGRDMETLLRLESEVLSLLYSLVFAAINYAGPRSDYSLAGWPTRAWPITQAPVAPPAPNLVTSSPAPAPMASPQEAAPQTQIDSALPASPTNPA